MATLQAINLAAGDTTLRVTDTHLEYAVANLRQQETP